jgi:hypothetical protein
MKKNPIFVSFVCVAAMLLLTLSSVSCKEEEQDDHNEKNTETKSQLMQFPSSTPMLPVWQLREYPYWLPGVRHSARPVPARASA